MKTHWIIIMLLMALLLASTNTLSFRPARAAATPRAEALIAAAQQAEAVRVIVSLNTGSQPETALAGTAPETQRARIAQAQENLLQRLSASLSSDSHFTVEHQYTTTPGMVLTVDETMLRELLIAPEVAAISEDLPLPFALNQSTSAISADYAWDNGYTGKGWTIAVLDTGIDRSHAFFDDRVVSEACFSSTRGKTVTTLCPNGQDEQQGRGAAADCGDTLEGCFHGTHVAGIATGQGDEFSGVAREANILAIQVFSSFDDPDQCGSETPCLLSYHSDQIQALEHVYEQRDQHQIAAVNLSLEGNAYASASACDAAVPAYTQAVENLVAANIAVIASTGNQGSAKTISYPACLSDVVSVGATSMNDTIASFSNSNALVDILAPGVRITSSFPGNEFQAMSGTSMAAPHVAGAWAVLRSQEPSASVEELRARLTTTGVPITDTRNNQTFPRMELYNAVRGEAAPPLVLEAVATPEAVAPGHILTYTLTVRNDKAESVTGLSLISDIPPGAVLFAASDDGTEQGSTVQWDNLELAGKGGELVRTVQIAISPSVLSRADATLSSAVSLKHADEVLHQTIETPLVSEAGASNPSLALTVASPTTSTVQSGQTIPSTYTITNTGNTYLSHITLSDQQGTRHTLTPSDLAPAQHLEGTITTTIGQDHEVGSLDVSFTVQALSPEQDDVTDRASYTVTVQAPEQQSYRVHLPVIEHRTASPE